MHDLCSFRILYSFMYLLVFLFFFFKQRTAYDMRSSDWSSDVCSSDLLKCLAGAVYFESKGETLAGQLAVARVVINRSQSGDFPDSICGVVYQPSQFSFIRDGRMPSIKTGSRAWHRAIAIAQIALNDSWDSSAEGALYFHARRVSPGWKHTKLASIDNHIFYR